MPTFSVNNNVNHKRTTCHLLMHARVNPQPIKVPHTSVTQNYTSESNKVPRLPHWQFMQAEVEFIKAMSFLNSLHVRQYVVSADVNVNDLNITVNSVQNHVRPVKFTENLVT
jgi:hypothetical protein